MHPSTRTNTHTHTYTKPRSEVVRDQFEIFLRYTDMGTTRRDSLLASIGRGELAAIGAYLEQGGRRFMEVEVEIDWKFHAQLKNAEGDLFDTDLPGWEEGGSPEINQYARQLSRIAKQLGLTVRHWIRVIPEIRSEPSRHKALCDALDYSFGSTVPPWRDGTPRERAVSVLDLPETTIYEREA